MNATTFPMEQEWMPMLPAGLDFYRRHGTSTGDSSQIATGAFAPARELLLDPWWAEKVQRGLTDSLTGRVRSLSEHRRTL
jgi:hypothetical protein